MVDPEFWTLTRNNKEEILTETESCSRVLFYPEQRMNPGRRVDLVSEETARSWREDYVSPLWR